MSEFKSKIKYLAEKYQLQLVYAFGSRAKESLNIMEGKKYKVIEPKSDLDIGIKAKRPLEINKKVDVAIYLEDLFDMPAVDVISIPEAPVFLALEIVQGELLYADNEIHEAEYQLYIMRQAAELMHYERQKKALVLGI